MKRAARALLRQVSASDGPVRPAGALQSPGAYSAWLRTLTDEDLYREYTRSLSDGALLAALAEARREAATDPTTPED